MATIRTLPNGKYRTDIRRKNTFIQAKTFISKNQAEQYRDEIESCIDSILNLKPKKIKKLSPAKVEELGRAWLFKKLGIELNFMTFEDLADEYMRQWIGKDPNQVYRALHWQEIFSDTPIKSITSKDVKNAVKVFVSQVHFPLMAVVSNQVSHVLAIPLSDIKRYYQPFKF